MLWEFAYYLQPLLRADGIVIKHLDDGQMPYNIDSIVGIQADWVLFK